MESVQNGFIDGTSCWVKRFSWGEVFSLAAFLPMTNMHPNISVLEKDFKFAKMLTGSLFYF